MLIKSDSASVSAIKTTQNNAHFVFNVTNCGKHQVLLDSKWIHQYLFKRDLLLSSITLEEILETRKLGISLLRFFQSYCFIDTKFYTHFKKINKIGNCQEQIGHCAINYKADHQPVCKSVETWLITALRVNSSFFGLFVCFYPVQQFLTDNKT